MKGNKTMKKLALSTLVAGSLAAIPMAKLHARPMAQYDNLGNGAQVRGSVLVADNTLVAEHKGEHKDDHKAGEGKCGEGKCGDKKDAAKDSKNATSKGKTAEGKCGEGKCGEGKDAKKADDSKNANKK